MANEVVPSVWLPESWQNVDGQAEYEIVPRETES